MTDIIYAMDLGNDNVVQYTLDTDSGALTHLSDVHMGAESGPRGQFSMEDSWFTIEDSWFPIEQWLIL